MSGFVKGVIFTIALLFAATVAAVAFGLIPSGADAKPSTLETLAAKASLHVNLSRESKGVDETFPVGDDDLATGVKLYAANCAVCHGASDAKPSTLSKGFYIEAPQLAKDGVEDDPETVTFLKLKHGIRFSAMPAFGETLSERDLRQLTAFLKRMDKLPPEVDAKWKNVPSVAPSTAS